MDWISQTLAHVPLTARGICYEVQKPSPKPKSRLLISIWNYGKDTDGLWEITNIDDTPQLLLSGGYQAVDFDSAALYLLTSEKLLILNKQDLSTTFSLKIRHADSLAVDRDRPYIYILGASLSIIDKTTNTPELIPLSCAYKHLCIDPTTGNLFAATRNRIDYLPYLSRTFKNFNDTTFKNISSITMDNHGNMYILDCAKSALYAATPRFGPDIRLLLGNPKIHKISDGSGRDVTFHYPRCMTTDPNGNIYVVDHKSVRKFREVLPWPKQRLIWIGFFKEDSHCEFAWLPRELIYEILRAYRS